MKMLWLLLLLLSICHGTYGVEGICEPIRIEMCRGLGYNLTTMPNLVGHEIQGDADFTLQTFSPLIQYGCSAQLHLFLCSVYAPMCTEKVPSPIGPCRGLCEQVRARCYPVLQGFGFPWPAALNCSKFPPKNNHQHMCMEGPGEPGPVSPIQVVGSGNGPWGCSWYANSGKYVFLNRSGRCAASCDADILWDKKEKRLTEVWMAAFTTICLISVTAAVFTLLKPKKQRTTRSTGESAIACLALCHAAVSIGYVIRLAAGRYAVACTPAIPLHPQDQVVIAQQQQQYLTQDGLANPYCAVVFLLLYYFGSAANVWWVVMCTWWCIAIRRWIRSLSSSPLKDDGFGLQQGFSTIGAVAAWGFPAAHTIAVLVTRDVDADELTGSCFVGQQSTRSLLLLVLIPQLIYLSIGTIFLIIGATCLLLSPSANPTTTQMNAPLHHTNPLMRQREIKSSPIEIYRRQKYLLTRIGIFSIIYFIIMILTTSIIFYEWLFRDDWLKAPEPSPIPKLPLRPKFQLFIMKIVVTFIGGIFAAGWIWWPCFKSIWRRMPPWKQPPQKFHPHGLPIIHCGYNNNTSTLPHQIHHLNHLGQAQQQQHFLHQHQVMSGSSGSGSRRGHKKYRKHRSYHSGSETQV